MSDPVPVVFVVDDDASIRDALMGLMRSVGLRGEAFASAREFLTHQRPEAPGCLVLDVRLPGLSGDEHVQTTRMLDYVMEEDRQRVQQQVLPAVMQHGRWEGETQFRHFQTGTAIPMLQHVFVLKEPGSDRPISLATISCDITQRKHGEGELLALKDELAAELIAMTRLHELSTRLLASTELQLLLDEILRAVIALRNADFGNVQLYNPDTQALEIVAQRGFQADFLAYFASVREESSACGRALQRQERIIIADVDMDPGFAPHRAIAASAGFRAVQSTPLFSRVGERLGMLSTHFRQPHCPSAYELRLTDLYARQAAEMIERQRAEEALLRTQADLAHVTRVMSLGELTASIAHEVNQPLAAVVTNGNACLRWLAREVPDLEEAKAAVERIVRDGRRASDVIQRIRSLSKRTAPQMTWLDLNDVIREVLAWYRARRTSGVSHC